MRSPLLPLQKRPNHATMLAADMAGVTSSLVVQCRMALGLTQTEFGDLFGRTKRTVQRWEERGALLIASEVEALLRALHSVRPDLAEQVAVAMGMTLDGFELPRAASHAGFSDLIESVVRAGAVAVGMTPDAIRPAVAAAFARAHEVGLDVHAVAQGLKRDETE